MELLPVKNGNLPISKNTAYKWNSLKKYPALIIKVGGNLFFDMKEWDSMAEQARTNQIKEAKKIHVRLNDVV